MLVPQWGGVETARPCACATRSDRLHVRRALIRPSPLSGLAMDRRRVTGIFPTPGAAMLRMVTTHRFARAALGTPACRLGGRARHGHWENPRKRAQGFAVRGIGRNPES